MVVTFAQAETKNIEAKCAADKLESRVRDLLKEKEFINNKMRAAMAEKQKAVTALQVKVEFKMCMMSPAEGFGQVRQTQLSLQYVL